jgi:hypothetical protein
VIWVSLGTIKHFPPCLRQHWTEPQCTCCVGCREGLEKVLMCRSTVMGAWHSLVSPGGTAALPVHTVFPLAHGVAYDLLPQP